MSTKEQAIQIATDAARFAAAFAEGWVPFLQEDTDRLVAVLQSIAQPEESAFQERDSSKPAEAQGIFHKFDVRRVDGSSGPVGKHEGCRYFVLDMDHDAHAAAALSAYAVSCKDTHPQLSADLLREFPAKPPAPLPQGEKDDPFEAVYCKVIGADSVAGLHSCDDFKDWKASILAREIPAVPQGDMRPVTEFERKLNADLAAWHPNSKFAKRHTAPAQPVAAQPAPTDPMDWTISHNGKSVTSSSLAKAAVAAASLRTEEETRIAAENLMRAIEEDTAQLESKDANRLAWPTELTADLAEVLGWPNFRCAPIARLFQDAGYDIKKRSEDEQAFVLHWLATLVLTHGDGWRDMAAENLRELQDKVADAAIAAPKSNGGDQ